MAPTSLHDIYKAIGTLSAQFDGLRRDIDAAERRAGAENREADEKRAIMHRRMDEVISEVSDIKVDIAQITSQVSDSKAVTDQVKQWKLMGLGALGVVGIAAGALGTIIATYWQDLIKIFRG